MERVADILIFFMKATSVVMVLWLVLRLFRFERWNTELTLVEDTKLLKGAMMVVLTLTFLYSWTL